MTKNNALVTTKKPVSASTTSPVAFIPDSVWRKMLQNASIASERLQRILISPSFGKLPIRDQAALIQLAHEQAFGVAGKSKQTVVVVSDEEDENGQTNVLRSLANKALVLPELKSADKQRRN